MSNNPIPLKLFPDNTEVYGDIDSLAKGINTVAAFLATNDKLPKDFNGSVHKITDELSNQLADTPENAATWDEFYSKVVPFALKTTMRTKDASESLLIVIGDYYSDEAKEQVKHVHGSEEIVS